MTPEQTSSGRNDTQAVLELVCNERGEQDAKWGKQNHDMHKWLTILMEEVGEAAERALNNDAECYGQELIQVAAVAVAAVECLNRQAKGMGE